MANTKTYAVVKDGETLEELKTLTAAKKPAEDAEVLCEGACVYAPAVPPVKEAELAAEERPETYTLLRRMNVRKAPSLMADKLTVLNAGAVVEVLRIENDWLYLTDGTFILYESGKNAEKNASKN